MVEEICYVYIIGTTTGAYKIGVAKDPYSRYETLKPGIPDPSSIKLVIRCRDRGHAFAVEGEMHNILGEYRSAGEWFRPPKNVLGELLLELGSDIEALAADTPVIEYLPTAYRPVRPDIDIIAHGTDHRITRDSYHAILGVICNLNGEHTSVDEEIIIKEAERIGIDGMKAAQILDRMKRDGDVGCVGPKLIRIFSEDNIK